MRLKMLFSARFFLWVSVVAAAGADETTQGARTSDEGQQSLVALVLEGGGVKGIAYGGAVWALQDAGLMPGLRYFAGTSAGSQAAMMLALGANASFLEEKLTSTDFAAMLDSDAGASEGGSNCETIGDDLSDVFCFWSLCTDMLDILRSGVRELLRRKSFFKGDKLEESLEEAIADLLNGTKYENKGDLTFGELHELSQLEPLRFGELRVVATNLSADPNARNTDRIKPETWFDHRNTPDVAIKKAVRASSSIPVVFQPVEIEVNGTSSKYVDGGTMANVPHNAFNDTLKSGEATLILLIGDDAEAPRDLLKFLEPKQNIVKCEFPFCLYNHNWWGMQSEGLVGIMSYVGHVVQVSVFPCQIHHVYPKDCDPAEWVGR